MLLRYAELMRTNEPVHTWPIRLGSRWSRASQVPTSIRDDAGTLALPVTVAQDGWTGQAALGPGQRGEDVIVVAPSWARRWSAGAAGAGHPRPRPAGTRPVRRRP